MTKSSPIAIFFIGMIISTMLPAQTTSAPVLLRPLHSGPGTAARRATLIQQRDVQLRKVDNAEQLRREAASMRHGKGALPPVEVSRRELYKTSRQQEVERYWGAALPAPIPQPLPEK